MTDLTLWIKTLRRPRLLVQAAKLGLADYNRERVLKRVAPTKRPQTAMGALAALIPVEETLEEARRSGDASYVPSRHVEVLIAVLSEIKALIGQRQMG
jgi:hypothetical protein